MLATRYCLHTTNVAVALITKVHNQTAMLARMYTCVHVCTCTHTMYNALCSSLYQTVEYSYMYTNSWQKSCT